MQQLMEEPRTSLAPAAEEVLAEARTTEIDRTSVMDVVRFIVVSLYLSLVLLLLLATRRISVGFTWRGLLRRLKSRMRRPFLGLRSLPHNAALPR